MKPEFKVGDIVRPNCKAAEEWRPGGAFKIARVYNNRAIKDEDKPKWCYLPEGEEPEWMGFGDEGEEDDGAPLNSWWEGYLELVKKKRYMEENE